MDALLPHTNICAALITDVEPVSPYINFGRTLRSPFAPTARTAVPLSAAPYAVLRRRYYSPSQVCIDLATSYAIFPVLSRWVNVFFLYFCCRIRHGLSPEKMLFFRISPFTNMARHDILTAGNQRNPFNSAREAGKARSDPS